MKKRGANEGSIYRRRDGRWAATVSLGYEGGKRRRKTFYGATQRDVREQLVKALGDIQQGLPIPSERLRTAAFLQQWLNDVAAPSVRASTFVRYRAIVEGHLIPAIGSVPIAKLEPRAVQALYTSKLAEGLSPRTVVHVHRVLHRALTYAVKWNAVARNVCDAVEPPRVARAEMKTLTVEQSRKVLDAAREDVLEALYVLALTTGMRQGELLGLKWEDIDIEGRSLTVRRAVGRLAGVGIVETEPKSAKARRRLVLAPLAVEALRRHRLRQVEARLLAGGRWNDLGLVFTNAAGGYLDHGNLLRRSFWPLLERAEVPRIRFHDLRHSVASLMLSFGTHPKVVQELLGHSQISLTLDTYSHLLPGLQQEAVGKLDALLGGSGG